MNKYLLSIVIPTKNRAKFANISIRQVLSLCNDKMQVIIQDNSDDLALKELLSDIICSSNLVYHHTYENLSFVSNFDQALSLAEGEYVTIIGDDDGITSELIRTVEWAKNRGILAVKPNLNIIYFWPNSKVFDSEFDRGKLTISPSKGTLRNASPYKSVKNLLENGAQDYLKQDLVKIYHGIVHKNLLNNIKDKTGKYVGGLSPDIYLSVALSLVTDRDVVCIDVPLTISGICSASGSSASSTGAHTGELSTAPHFKGHISYNWSSKVPDFYSVETIWADSAISAVNDINPSLNVFFRMESLVGVCLGKYHQFGKIIWKTYIDNNGNKYKYYTWQVKHFIYKVKSSLMYRLFHKTKNEWNDVSDIFKASEIIETNLVDLYSNFRKSHNED